MGRAAGFLWRVAVREGNGRGSPPARRVSTLVFRLIPQPRRVVIFYMLTVLVYVRVKPECVQAFLDASLENARHSRLEPGIAQFDVLHQQDDPNRFVLVESYRTATAPASHKETAHYLKWRDAVAPMMAEPRSSVKYHNPSAA